MTSPALDLEPACPGAPSGPTSTPSAARSDGALQVEQRPFDAIPRDAWDELAAATPWATPFSSHAFHRAWWDAYGANAHEQTLIVCRADATQPLAIVPLMHRHQVEPTDQLTQSTMRHGGPTTLTPVAPTAKAIFFGATYHADYATVLAAPETLPEVAEAVAAHLAAPPSPFDPHPSPWDVVDLRRLRCGDPAADALAAAFGRREISEGWTLNVEREDVCPVVHLPEGASFDDYLGDARQEGAPRDPAEDAASRGGRGHRAHQFDRPARGPRGLHRPAPAQVGRAGPLPADARWRRLTNVC